MNPYGFRWISVKDTEEDSKGFQVTNMYMYVLTFATIDQVPSAALFWEDATGWMVVVVWPVFEEWPVVEVGADVIVDDVDVIAVAPVAWDGVIVVPAFAVAWDDNDVLPGIPVVGNDEGVAPAFPVMRDDAATLTLLSGRRLDMKDATLEGNGESDT